MFQLTPRRHELISVFMMSLGTTFMFLGYDVQAMMAESVLHSVSTRNPERISEYAGYYGLVNIIFIRSQYCLPDKLFITYPLHFSHFSQLLFNIMFHRSLCSFFRLFFSSHATQLIFTSIPTFSTHHSFCWDSLMLVSDLFPFLRLLEIFSVQ